ncbi:DUF2786 domain-containing protein, partial [Balamuthia mandrillaris]
METVWELHKEGHPGKPMRLKPTQRAKEYFLKDLTPGQYALILHTTDHLLPGGKKGPRYISCDVEVRAPHMEKPLWRDIYKLHSGSPTEAIEFEVKPETSPASLRLYLQSHSPFLLGMKVMAKLVKNYAAEVARLTEEFLSQPFGASYKTLELEDILSEMRRTSEYRIKAHECGMTRPFLYLVSMHPATRQQVADILNIDLVKSKKFGDAHAEAWKIIHAKRHGIQFRAEHTWETLNPGNKPSNWHSCLRRGLTNVYPKEHRPEDIGKGISDRDSIKVAEDSQDHTVSNLELLFLEDLRKTHRGQMKKVDEKHPDAHLVETCKRLLHETEIIALRDILATNGITSEKVRRFLIELCVFLHYNLKQEESEKDEFRRRELAHEEEHKGQSVSHSITFHPLPTSPSPAFLLDGLKAQLLNGAFDPRSLTQKGYGVAKTGGSFAAKQAFKYIVLSSFFPPLVPVATAYGVIEFFAG